MSNSKVSKIENKTSSIGEQLKTDGTLKTLIKVSLPIVIMMLADASYAFIDSIMASRMVDYGNGYNAGDVLGFIQPIIGFFMVFTMIFIVGTTMTYTKSLAKNDSVAANKNFNSGLSSGIIMAFLVFLVIWFVMPSIVYGFGTTGDSIPQQAIDEGIAYARTVGLVLGIYLVRDTIGRALRSEGYNRTYALIVILSIPLNLLLNWVFMGVLDTGLVGAGYASLIAALFGLFAVIIVWSWLRYQRKVSLEFNIKHFYPKFELVWMIVLFGLGSAIRRTAGSIMMISMISLTNSLGDNWKQWMNVSTKAVRLTSQISLAIGQAAAVLFTFSYYNKDHETVKEINKLSMIGILITQLVILAFMMPLGYQFMNWFNVRNVTATNNYAWMMLCLFGFARGFTIMPAIYMSIKKDLKGQFKFSFLSDVLLAAGSMFVFYGIYVGTGSQYELLFFAWTIFYSVVTPAIVIPLHNKEINKDIII